MAKQEAKMVKKVRVKMGRLIPVYNQDPRRGAKPVYVSVRVEDADGKNERCLLFTQAQIDAAARRAAANPEDCPKPGSLTDLFD